MFKSIRYVLKENFTNLYRIYCISKYELLSDMRDSRLGVFWNFANPAIQIITYYFVFGLIMNRKAVGKIPFIQWMLCGMVVWFFISPCITNGANAIYAKRNVITKMKFPVSVLPATVVGKELFNHFCLMAILVVFLLTQGIMPSLYWLELIYYLFAAICLTISLAMITSVLNMLARDTRKLILACMRLLLYLTPIYGQFHVYKYGWQMTVRYIMKANPIYYIVCGYERLFLISSWNLILLKQMLFFWVFVIVIFTIGSMMMYKFKHKFIDMI